MAETKPTMTSPTPEQRARLRGLLHNATKRPWVLFHTGTTLEIDDNRGHHSRNAVVHWTGFDASNKNHDEKIVNATLMVDSINLLPSLLDYIDRLEKVKEAAKRGHQLRFYYPDRACIKCKPEHLVSNFTCAWHDLNEALTTCEEEKPHAD